MPLRSIVQENLFYFPHAKCLISSLTISRSCLASTLRIFTVAIDTDVINSTQVAVLRVRRILHRSMQACIPVSTATYLHIGHRATFDVGGLPKQEQLSPIRRRRDGWLLAKKKCHLWTSMTRISPSYHHSPDLPPACHQQQPLLLHLRNGRYDAWKCLFTAPPLRVCRITTAVPPTAVFHTLPVSFVNDPLGHVRKYPVIVLCDWKIVDHVCGWRLDYEPCNACSLWSLLFAYIPRCPDGSTGVFLAKDCVNYAWCQ